MTRRSLSRNSLPAATLLVLALGLAVVPGCKKKEPPPPAPPQPAVAVKPAAKPVQAPISSSLRLPPAPVTPFDFSTKKDPFKPYVVVKPPTTTAESARRASQLPIHSYDVSQFKLIGVITGSKESQAMVTDPAGKGYVLRPGMTIGKNDGRVTAITAKGVEVLEQFRDDNGRVRKEVIRLTLPRKY